MEKKEGLALLFDLSFTEFISTRIIKVLFVVGVAIAAIAAIVSIIGGFASSAGRGLLSLILSPVVFLLYVILLRVWCEVIIALFRIAENTSRALEK